MPLAPIRKYGQSLLGEPVGIAEQQARDQVTRANSNQHLEEKKIQSLGRRAYRDGIRNKNWGQAMDALDFATKRTGSTGAGIGIAGADEAAITGRNAQNVGYIRSGQGQRLVPADGLALPQPGSVPGKNGTANTQESIFSQVISGNLLNPDPKLRGNTINLGVGDNEFGQKLIPILAQVENEGGIKDANAPNIRNVLPNLLGQRQDLFNRMRQAGPGGMGALRGEAQQLGIGDDSWRRGVERAAQFDAGGRNARKVPDDNAAIGRDVRMFGGTRNPTTLNGDALLGNGQHLNLDTSHGAPVFEDNGVGYGMNLKASPGNGIRGRRQSLIHG